MICKGNRKYTKGQQRNFAPSTLMVIWFPDKFHSSNFMLLIVNNFRDVFQREEKSKHWESSSLAKNVPSTRRGWLFFGRPTASTSKLMVSKARYKSAKM